MYGMFHSKWTITLATFDSAVIFKIKYFKSSSLYIFYNYTWWYSKDNMIKPGRSFLILQSVILHYFCPIIAMKVPSKKQAKNFP